MRLPDNAFLRHCIRMFPQSQPIHVSTLELGHFHSFLFVLKNEATTSTQDILDLLVLSGQPLSWMVGAVEATVASSVTGSFYSPCVYDNNWGSVALVLEMSSSGCAKNWSMHWMVHTEISVGIRRKHWRTLDIILKPKCGILCTLR